MNKKQFVLEKLKKYGDTSLPFVLGTGIYLTVKIENDDLVFINEQGMILKDTDNLVAVIYNDLKQNEDVYDCVAELAAVIKRHQDTNGQKNTADDSVKKNKNNNTNKNNSSEPTTSSNNNTTDWLQYHSNIVNEITDLPKTNIGPNLF